MISCFSTIISSKLCSTRENIQTAFVFILRYILNPPPFTTKSHFAIGFYLIKVYTPIWVGMSSSKTVNIAGVRCICSGRVRVGSWKVHLFAEDFTGTGRHTNRNADTRVRTKINDPVTGAALCPTFLNASRKQPLGMVKSRPFHGSFRAWI